MEDLKPVWGFGLVPPGTMQVFVKRSNLAAVMEFRLELGNAKHFFGVQTKGEPGPDGALDSFDVLFACRIRMGPQW
jgi:hypothetical protein